MEARSLSSAPPLFLTAPCLRTIAAIRVESSVVSPVFSRGLVFRLWRCRVDSLLVFWHENCSSAGWFFAAFLTFLFRVFLDLQKHLSRISGFYPRKQKTGTTEATKQHRTLDREGSKYSFRQHVAVKVLFFCFYRSINDFKYFQQLTQGSSALHVSVSLGVYLFLNVQMSQIQFNINNLHEWNLDWNKNTFMYIWTFWFHPSESKKTFYSHNSRLWPLNWNKWCFFHLQLHLRWNYIIT